MQPIESAEHLKRQLDDAMANHRELVQAHTVCCQKLEAVKKERDELQAKCAEMREALGDIKRLLIFLANDIDYQDKAEERRAQESIVKRLSMIASLESSDCGKGCVSVRELDNTKALLRYIADSKAADNHLSNCRCWICAIQGDAKRDLARLEALTK